MNSGIPISPDPLRRSVRTALLVNIAGTQLQKSDWADENGVPFHRFYKVLANAIWDWHWMGLSEPRILETLGIGDLVWIPHSLGGMGMVSPTNNEPFRAIKHGRIVNYAELFRGKQYSQFGFRGLTQQGEDRHLQFCLTPISTQLIEKFPLSVHEASVWQQLIECYARLDEPELRALASCRNETMTFHSLWFQFVVWRSNMTAVMNELIDNDPDSFGDLLRRIKAAEAVNVQFGEITQFVKDREMYIERARRAARHSEFSTNFPFVMESPNWNDGWEESSMILRGLIPALEDLHELMMIALSTIKLADGRGPIGRTAALLEAIQDKFPEAQKLSNPDVWQSLMKGEQKKLGANCLALIDIVFKTLELQIRQEFRTVTNHYQYFLSDDVYPLPRAGFLPGY